MYTTRSILLGALAALPAFGHPFAQETTTVAMTTVTVIVPSNQTVTFTALATGSEAPGPEETITGLPSLSGTTTYVTASASADSASDSDNGWAATTQVTETLLTASLPGANETGSLADQTTFSLGELTSTLMLNQTQFGGVTVTMGTDPHGRVTPMANGTAFSLPTPTGTMSIGGGGSDDSKASAASSGASASSSNAAAVETGSVDRRAVGMAFAFLLPALAF